MNRSLAFPAFAVLLLAGSALAQNAPATSPTADDRVDRHCTASTLATDEAAPCPDDVVVDSGLNMPRVVRPLSGNTTGSGTTGNLPSASSGTSDTGTPSGSSGAGTPGSASGSGSSGAAGSIGPGTAAAPAGTGQGAMGSR